MECHYDILEVSRNATPDDLKKSYRRLVLQWHPDKNLENTEECKKRFQLIQQAYEVLSDPQERAFYDKYRDEILRGGLNGNYKDESLDVFQYFNANCYSGFHDGEKGFYTVYRDVFARIAEEDKAFLDDDDGEIDFPSFGASTDSYDEIVHPFYAYWQSYCTAKSYVWISKYDIQEAPNRRILRLMEKENNKLRNAARRKRNEEVRELTAFVRKRDKRVQAHKKELEEQAAMNAKRAEEHRIKMIQERKESLAQSKDTQWMSLDDLENHLKAIESQVDLQFGQRIVQESESEDEESEEDAIDETLYCIACDKLFQSEKTKLNHEKSKKHLENVAVLKTLMHEEDEASKDLEIQQDVTIKQHALDGEDLVSLTDEEAQPVAATSKKKKKNKKQVLDLDEVEIEISLDHNKNEDSDSKVEKVEKKKKSRRKAKTQGESETKIVENNTKLPLPDQPAPETESNMCAKCKKDFPTRNKLFNHLKTSGHQLYIAVNEKKKQNDLNQKEEKRTKGKKTKGFYGNNPDLT